MKLFVTSLFSVAAILLVGACDSHSFEETKVLHEKYQKHDHGDHHEGGEHKAEAGHGTAKDDHAAPHGEKKEH